MDMFGYDAILFILLIILIAIEYTALLGGMYFFMYYKPKRLNTVKNNRVKKEKDETKKEFRVRSYCDRVPEISNRLTVIILRENKSSKILYFSLDEPDFIFGKCLYFIVNPHTCDNGAKLAVYLEGISLPLSYENVEKETVEREYIDLDGKKKKSIITRIKNLQWDGKILYMFSNRKFAENFTKIEPDLLPFITMLVGIVTLIVACIGIGVTWFTH